jgi:hypothetical protein
MQKYLVTTGIVIFTIEARSPRHAIDVLKQMIDHRRHEHYNPEIGMSLVEALDRGDLNFVVMDHPRTQLLCGELAGEFQDPVSRELADIQRRHIPDSLYYTTQPYDPDYFERERAIHAERIASGLHSCWSPTSCWSTHSL